MSRATRWLLSLGLLLFIGVIASQGVSTIAATLALAGWGLLLVALFHALPLLLDAAAIRVLFAGQGSLRDALVARWVGESANSLMPAGQLGGPVLMARHLVLRGMGIPGAAAAITVSTTLQILAQIGFAVIGLGLVFAHPDRGAAGTLRIPSLIAGGMLALPLGGFYLLQRRNLFSRLTRTAERFFVERDWTREKHQALAVDHAVQLTYGRGKAVAGSFALSSIGWLVGTGEVYLILQLLRCPVSWSDALMLESLGQAVRGASFAIPGALGVQEGGYLLLASLAGLPADAGLALSLAKRVRELVLGIPGLMYLHLSEYAGIKVW